MVSRKELVDISGQGLCGGWKAGNSRKRSRRSPEARTAGGPTLRGRHDLLDVRPNRGDLTSGVNFRRHRPSQQTAASIAELFGGAPSRLYGKRRLSERLASGRGDVQLRAPMSRTRSIPAPTELRCTGPKAETLAHLQIAMEVEVTAPRLLQSIRSGKL
jgi:hypothetical protein